MAKVKVVLAGYRDRYGAAGEVGDRYVELERLADTSGARSVRVVTQPEAVPSPKFFVGSGKASEIADAVSETCSADVWPYDFASRTRAVFDLLFVDPPYRDTQDTSPSSLVAGLLGRLSEERVSSAAAYCCFGMR